MGKDKRVALLGCSRAVWGRGEGVCIWNLLPVPDTQVPVMYLIYRYLLCTRQLWMWACQCRFQSQHWVRPRTRKCVGVPAHPFIPAAPAFQAIQAAQICDSAANLLRRVFSHTDVPTLIAGDFNSLASKRQPDVFDQDIPRGPEGLVSGVYIVSVQQL